MTDQGRSGRPSRPIDPDSPAAGFAADLRELLEASGLTYRRLAAETGLAPSTLSRALSGQQLPSWNVVERMLPAVGVEGQAELGRWRRRWSAINEPMAPVRADVRFDPRAPIFYLGHAHASGPAKGTGLVERLFDDLATHVQEMLPLMPGQDTGFLDRRVGGGEAWRQEVLHAIGTCHVYVPLVSPRYLTSPWCRFEWRSVAARTVSTRHGARSDIHTPIVPVLWTAIDRATLPPPIQEVQMFIPSSVPPGIVEAYMNEGLYGLMQMQLDREYNALVWRLAQRIVDIAMRYETTPLIPDAKDLSGSFLDDIDRLHR